jgi:hypothetical protein
VTTLIEDLEPYVPIPGTPEVLLVDLDGTMCLMGDRSPYDWTKVCEDRPNQAVVDMVTLLNEHYEVIFVSGRMEGAREQTEVWLATHAPNIDYVDLFMRPDGDMRQDSDVKTEIFDREIREKYTVAGVFDDRNQVVERWRALGLQVYQVADGNF